MEELLRQQLLAETKRALDADELIRSDVPRQKTGLAIRELRDHDLETELLHAGELGSTQAQPDLGFMLLSGEGGTKIGP